MLGSKKNNYNKNGLWSYRKIGNDLNNLKVQVLSEILTNLRLTHVYVDEKLRGTQEGYRTS